MNLDWLGYRFRNKSDWFGINFNPKLWPGYHPASIRYWYSIGMHIPSVIVANIRSPRHDWPLNDKSWNVAYRSNSITLSQCNCITREHFAVAQLCGSYMHSACSTVVAVEAEAGSRVVRQRREFQQPWVLWHACCRPGVREWARLVPVEYQRVGVQGHEGI